MQDMTKHEFLALLRSAGFEAWNDAGVIMITSTRKKDLDEIRKLAKKHKYFGSYGWQLKQLKGEQDGI